VTLQEGIYHQSRARPGAFFGILFLRVDPEQPAAKARAVLARLWARYRQLRKGELPQLPGHPVPHGDLSVLIGFGLNLFNRNDIRTRAPPELERFGRFRSPEPGGGGLLLTGSGLRYATDVTQNPATEDIAIQLIANSQLAVNRGIVETWDLLTTNESPAAGVPPPVQLGAFYLGFQRDDGRSWIDFHDGVSNLRSADRPSVIEIKPAADPAHSWADGGTYLTFVRTEVDIAAWRSIPRSTQERLVGRDKLTGAPLERVAGRANVSVTGCPVPGTTEVIERGNEAFREPAAVTNPTILASHVQRANHHVPNPADPNSLRVYRQGYEFLESSPNAPGFRAGLNFVAFTDTPQRLARMLTTAGWLAETNFGGRVGTGRNPNRAEILTIRAAAVFLAPPETDGESFPGAHAFG
jgi:deferrochelatase/peroxidase EfeB